MDGIDDVSGDESAVGLDRGRFVGHTTATRVEINDFFFMILYRYILYDSMN